MKAAEAAATTTLMNFDDVVAAQGVIYEEGIGWDGRKIGLLSITAGEVLEWLDDKADPAKSKDSGLLLLARSMVLGDRTRVCGTPERERQMVESLKTKDSKTVMDLTNIVLRINGITTAPETVKKD